MRKLFTLLIVLSLWASSSMGQVTVTIGTGTLITTGSTSTITPYKTYWMDGQDQILFTAAELAGAGLGAGNITKLAFNVGGTPNSATLNSFTISAQNSALTSLTAFLTTGWTTCYTGNVVAVAGWNTYTFTTPIAWDGVSSVVFKVCFNNTGYTSNSHVFYSATPATGAHLRWYGDLSTTSGCDQTTSTGTINRPNVQITGQPGALPLLTAIPNTLLFGFSATATVGQSYVLAGSNLSAGPIAVTAPAGFEVSLNNTTWTGSVSVPYTAPTLGNTTIYVRFNPPAPGTAYSGNVTNVGGGTNINVAVSGTSDLFGAYCTSGASSTGDEDITHVTFGSSLNNISACASLTGSQGVATGTADLYSNFTSITPTNIEKGTVIPISVEITECALTAYSHSVMVYIDWNQNGSLEDVGEAFTIWGYASSNTHTVTANITVPLTATVGNTLMRVVCKESATTGPCLVSSWGETEDYKVNITPAQLGMLQGYVYDMQGGCSTALKFATVSNGVFTTLTDGAGFYQFAEIPVGTYNFTASLTDYVNQTVNGIAITLGGTTNQDFCLEPYLAPPVSLNATVTGVLQNNAHVTWNAPGSLPPAQWIKWDNGTNTDAIGTGAAAAFAVASRWPVADIAPYAGMYLNKIEFWPAVAAASATYTIKVWTGVTPPVEVYSYVIPSASITSGAFNTITFPGILISGTEEFWFGYEVNTTTGYPAGCDAGPQIAGKGNMVQWGGVWQELTDLNAALTYNWNIHGYLSQTAMGPQLTPLMAGQPVEPVTTVGTLKAGSLGQTTGNVLPAGRTAKFEVEKDLTQTPSRVAARTGYNVYRNTVAIATNIPDAFYDDAALAVGGYDYQVSAQYDYGESVKIGPAHVEIISCHVPTNVNVAAATTTLTSAIATWTPSIISTNPEWVVEYGVAGFAHGAGIAVQTVAVPTFSMGSLTPGTTYDFYVRTYCAPGDSSVWVKKTFTTHYFDCPVGATAEVETCSDSTNNGCNVVAPLFEPLACGETKCGTAYFDGGNRDTDWYTFTLAANTTVTWSGKAEFSYVLGIIASPCPATAFIASASGAAGTIVSVTTTLAAGTYYAFAAPQFAEIVACDSLDHYFATFTCNTDINAPVITNVVSTPGNCATIDHVVTADITDDISIGAVNIVWTLDGVAQANIPMIASVDPSYSGTIPAQGSGQVAFHIEASDNAVPVNTASSATVNYQDSYLSALNLNAGSDQVIALNSSTTLNATYSAAASCLKITEITLFSSGTGATAPYPAFLVAGSFDDLVEITNTGTAATDLAGIHLKCEGLRVTDYVFPSAIVPPGGVVTVAFGTAANSIPDLYFNTGQTNDAWSSGTNNGIWLTTATGTIIDAVATNAWTFSVGSGVTASDWSGAGAPALSGNAGTRLTGADANTNANWVTAATSTQNIGTVNAGVPLTCSVTAYTLTWSGGNLPAPVVANPVTTPTFDVPNTYVFTATLSDGLCSISDDMSVLVPVPAPPVADFTVNNPAQTTGGLISTALFTDLSTNLPDSWAWIITGPGTANYVNATTNTSKNPQVQFTAPGLYTVELTATNTAGSNTMTKTDYITVTIEYCSAIPSSNADEEIFSVTVNGATNAYACGTVAPGPGSILNRYSNFTTLGSLTTINQGSTISFTILEDECDGATYYTNGCAIWIDYNQDGDFIDVDEQIFVESILTSSPRTISGSFVVPVTAPIGSARMRIIVAEGLSGAGLTPCMSYSFGETEDYLVTVGSPLVTFQVNMSSQTVSPLGVHIAGSFQGWDPAATPMADMGGGIYAVTLPLAPGDYQYKFVNGNAWGMDESVPGACNVGGNRGVTVTGPAVLDPVCFGSCTNCVPQIPLTLTVDMANQIVSPLGVHVAGSFQGWNAGSTLMTQIPATTMYEVMIYVDENSTHQYKFINGNNWPESEVVPGACGVDNGFGGFNRTVTVGTGMYSADVVCFGECALCIPSTKTLNLTVLLEGLYTPGGTMNQAFDDMGPHFVAPVADQITVELHDGTTYTTVVYDAGLVDLNQDGTATVNIPATYGDSYYVTVKHRNSLETTTAAVVDFSGATIAYDFTTAASQAYGDNLKDMGEGKFVIFGGDASPDGSIDALDLIAVDNDASAFAAGYLPTDVNGDGAVDALDLILTDNNSSLFIAAILP